MGESLSIVNASPRRETADILCVRGLSLEFVPKLRHSTATAFTALDVLTEFDVTARRSFSEFRENQIARMDSRTCTSLQHSEE
jgi:hypothetical protein